MNKSIKHPCIGCIYFKVCGKTNRRELCAGRMTKTDKKKEKKNESKRCEK